MFIDMTAMSDVTVLLLTFFMLTASFVKKEPVQVVTPASISEIKIPETNIMSILVDPGGRIFMSLDKQNDMAATLEAMGKEYGLTFTPQEIKKFSLFPTFGVPMKNMKSFFRLLGIICIHVSIKVKRQHLMAVHLFQEIMKWKVSQHV